VRREAWSALVRHARTVDPAPLLWAIAIVAWVCIHASGVHATVTGIMLGLLTPVRPRDGETTPPANATSTGCTRCPPGSPCRCSRS
jgi:Na+/H+ antiporter NhaA